MAAWLSTLPAPLASGYGITPADQALRTDMDSGAARVRRRTAARNDRVSVGWVFTDAQLSAFRSWFDDAASGAAGGAAWFTVLLAIGTGGPVSVEARFIGAYKIANRGALNWSVSAELEVR